MPDIRTFLWFDGCAEEAAKFYTSVFPNSSISGVTHYGEAGPGEPGSIMTVEFTVDGRPFVGLNGGPDYRFSEAISFQIHCADQAEVDRYWDALTDGGEEGPCGWLKDRFGVSWQVVPTALLDLIQDPDPARSQRAMQAMFGMKRLDIAALQAAAG